MPIVTKLGPLALAAPLVAVLAVPASSAEKAAQKRAPKAAAPEAVAIIGGEPITSAQFEELAGPRLFAARTQEKRTSSDVIGVPSEKSTFGRKWKV